ncbi:hypothetical protein [Bradyrhizobium sp.]|uniref:hypothetical protein n=1 Tax=Bradyrhizobium sp. TaxID=376 RepID=UPI003C6F50AD
MTLAWPAAAQDSMANELSQWGLIGPWSLDCALPPDHDKGAVLDYEIEGADVINRRDFGDAKDEGKVISATVSKDGMLNLRVFYASVKQTREYGLMMQPDGTLRAMYNRNDKKQYTIKNGKFTADGKPTPAQHKCEKPAS